MRCDLTSTLHIYDPSSEVTRWVKKHLILDNPNYIKKARMGKWTGNTPKTLALYVQTPYGYILPAGCTSDIERVVDMPIPLKPVSGALYGVQSTSALRPYQVEAVSCMKDVRCGILQAPCGAGKTRIMLTLAGTLGLRTLWIVHTRDLLTQARSAAIGMYGKEGIGTIGAGKCVIGDRITFATIQSLNKMDLSKIYDMWDAVMVDECHHAVGTVTSMTMYAHVLNSLYSTYRWGCTATAYRADGLDPAMTALLGPIVHVISSDDVSAYRVPVKYIQVPSDWSYDPSDHLDSYGTISYTSVESALTEDEDRNGIIADIIREAPKPCLVLSKRLHHLDLLDAIVPGIKLKKKRGGRGLIMYATYALSSEGLDIPDLASVILASPTKVITPKDARTFEQAVGRVQRTSLGKVEGIVYDIIDTCPIYDKWTRGRSRFIKNKY
ncbi:MAG: DEAD/DEAH box helicase family protein [Sphaerochaetaceae bacterium]